MGYVLLGLLTIELIIFYLFNGKSVVSPSFLACAGFILSTCIYLTGEEYFGYELHFSSVRVILLLLVFIFAGELLANRIRVKEKSLATDNTVKPVCLNVYLCIFMAIVVLFLSAIRFKEVYDFSLRVGNTPGNFMTMAKFVRSAKLNGTATLDLSILASQGTVISECAVFFCVYCLSCNKSCTGEFYWRYVPVILCYLPQIMASDNRTAFLRTLTICVIIVFVFVKQKYGWKSKGNLKIILIALVLVGLFFLLFRLLGYRTETSLRSEAWDNITEYTSASLVGFDMYLRNPEAPNILFGQWTLKGIYMILRQWGFTIPEVPRFEKFFYYAKGEANIYTGFKPYIQDYTLLGAAVAMFLWGLLISYGMKYIRKNGAGFLRLCFMGMMFYPVVMLSMDDTTSTVLSISTLYTFFYLALFDIFFIKKSVRLRLT